MGGIEEGINHLQNALEKVDSHHRYIFLLYTVGGLSFKEIAHIIKQRDAITKYCYETTVVALYRNLDNISDGTLLIEQINSLTEQALSYVTFPETIENSCIRQIKVCAKSPFPPKKVVIPIICVIIFIIGVVMAVALMPKDDTMTTSGDDNSVSNTSADPTDASIISSPVIDLDETLTYYADIEFKDYGTITVELDQESAPVTVANFVNLAQNGFYDGLTFHRIIEDFMMQGGDPNGDGTGGNTNENGNEINIVGEFTDNGHENSLSHTRGAISMARSNEYDSASSQFFIVHEDSSASLDGQYAVFGYVTEGLDIVDTICESAEPTDDNGTIEAETQPVISSVTIRTE